MESEASENVTPSAPEFSLSKAEAEICIVALGQLRLGGTIDEAQAVMKNFHTIAELRQKLTALIAEMDKHG